MDHDTEREVCVYYPDTRTWQYEPIDKAPMYKSGVLTGSGRERWVVKEEPMARKYPEIKPAKEENMVVTQGTVSGTASVFRNFYESGKRNPTQAILLNSNPDGTANLFISDGKGSTRFVFNVPTRRPYGDDASQPYAEVV